MYDHLTYEEVFNITKTEKKWSKYVCKYDFYKIKNSAVDSEWV